LHGVFPCGLLRTVCSCCIHLFDGMVYVGVEGKWCDLSERGWVCWVGGFGDFMAGGVLAGL
jgi:hypothetical protein